eukprot:gene23917-9488_t
MATAASEPNAHDFKPRPHYPAQGKTPLLVSSGSSFIPRNDSPGPGAYSPQTDVVKNRGARGVFGSATRDKESNRWISDAHQKGEPPRDTPGPARYRTHTSDTFERNPKNQGSPSWGFGTASQRTDYNKTPQASVPGPIYGQQASWDAEAYSFAPPGDTENGMARSRNEFSPADYDTENLEAMSVNRRGETMIFSKSSRAVHDSMPQALIKQDPMSGTAAITPGAVYNLPENLDKRAQKFGTGPKFYSPENGASSAGPYLGRGHETMCRGSEGPGPGAYTDNGGRNKAVTGLGDAPTFKFGTERMGGDRTESNVQDVPGPGAYTPKDESASRAQTAPSYSLGSYIRGDVAPASQRFFPGPGQYNTLNTVPTKSARQPSYSFGSVGPEGRTSFVRISKTPGAGTYSVKGGFEDGPPSPSSPKKKGFSFGAKEKTISAGSMVTHRYQGPLGQAEAMGVHSPGPGRYYSENAKESHKMNVPITRFGTANRNVKVSLSREQAAADGSGVDSPGPGTYNHSQLELAEVTSRYRRPATAAFSTTARFKSGSTTF